MANPHPDTSGLKPPWKKGESGNPRGYRDSDRAAKELLKLFKSKQLWPQVAKTFAVKALGQGADAKWMQLLLRVLRQFPEQNKETDALGEIDSVDPAEAAYLAEVILKARRQYADSQASARNPDPEGNQEVPGDGRPGGN